VSGLRKLRSWIDAFLEYTDRRPTPRIFRLWAGLSCVAGALERRVWLTTTADRLYPNLFVLLVSPPGVGKDQAIAVARDFWSACGGLNVAPVAMSHKGLIDQLADDTSRKRIIDTTSGEIQFYHSLLVAVPELGVILPKHDLGFLSLLNELFSCYDVFEERIRGYGSLLHIDRPHISLLSGTQPRYMDAIFPEAAFGMGFTARVIMVFHGEPVRVPLFAFQEENRALRQDMLSDLRAIAKLQGQFQVTPEAAAAIEAWHAENPDPPQHSRLQHYCTRRTLHLLKLCITISAAKRNDLTITMEDMQEAEVILLEAERTMPEIFREMTSGGQSAILEELFSFVMELYAPKKKPVPERKIVHFLSIRAPAHQIQFLIDTSIRSGMFKVMDLGTERAFIPADFGLPE